MISEDPAGDAAAESHDARHDDDAPSHDVDALPRRAPTTDQLLCGYWAPRFRAPHIDHRLATAITRFLVPPMDTSAWRIPGPSDVEGALRAAKDSAAGPDGIPYSGWRHTGRAGHLLLTRVALDLAAARPPMRSLLASVGGGFSPRVLTPTTCRAVAPAHDEPPILGHWP